MTLVRGDLASSRAAIVSATFAAARTSRTESTCTCGAAWATTGSCTASSTTPTSSLAPRSRSNPLARKARRSVMSTRLFKRFREAEPATEAAAGNAKSPREALNEQWLRIRAGLGGSTRSTAWTPSIEPSCASCAAQRARRVRSSTKSGSRCSTAPLAERVSQYVARCAGEPPSTKAARSRRRCPDHRNPIMRALVNETSRVAENCATSVRDVVLVATLQHMVHYLIASYGTIAAHAKVLGLDGAGCAVRTAMPKRSAVRPGPQLTGEERGESAGAREARTPH